MMLWKNLHQGALPCSYNTSEGKETDSPSESTLVVPLLWYSPSRSLHLEFSCTLTTTHMRCSLTYSQIHIFPSSSDFRKSAILFLIIVRCFVLFLSQNEFKLSITALLALLSHNISKSSTEDITFFGSFVTSVCVSCYVICFFSAAQWDSFCWFSERWVISREFPGRLVPSVASSCTCDHELPSKVESNDKQAAVTSYVMERHALNHCSIASAISRFSTTCSFMCCLSGSRWLLSLVSSFVRYFIF